MVRRDARARGYKQNTFLSFFWDEIPKTWVLAAPCLRGWPLLHRWIALFFFFYLFIYVDIALLLLLMRLFLSHASMDNL